jgi:hypothetical protein
MFLQSSLSSMWNVSLHQLIMNVNFSPDKAKTKSRHPKRGLRDLRYVECNTYGRW